MARNFASVVVLIALSPHFSLGGGAEGKKKPSGVKPSATVDFSALSTLVGVGTGKIRVVATTAEGEEFAAGMTFPFPQPNLGSALSFAFGTSFRLTGEAEGKGWVCESDGARLTLTAWNAGKGRVVPIKGIRVISPDASVPAKNLPKVTVQGGVVVNPGKEKGSGVE